MPCTPHERQQDVSGKRGFLHRWFCWLHRGSARVQGLIEPHVRVHTWLSVLITHQRCQEAEQQMPRAVSGSILMRPSFAENRITQPVKKRLKQGTRPFV
jgi:hypothetical protein